MGQPDRRWHPATGFSGEAKMSAIKFERNERISTNARGVATTYAEFTGGEVAAYLANKGLLATLEACGFKGFPMERMFLARGNAGFSIKAQELRNWQNTGDVKNAPAKAKGGAVPMPGMDGLTPAQVEARDAWVKAITEKTVTLEQAEAGLAGSHDAVLRSIKGKLANGGNAGVPMPGSRTAKAKRGAVAGAPA
jgi:hypothetical protein